MNHLDIISILLSIGGTGSPIYHLFTIYKNVHINVNNMRAKYMISKFKKSLNNDEKELFNNIINFILSGKKIRRANLIDFILGKYSHQNSLYQLSKKFIEFSKTKKWLLFF